jgi:hypothetical protein
MPPFFKPLSVVDGKSLIVSAISGALDYGAKTVWVVVAPENAGPIISVVRDGVVIGEDSVIRYIVQPEANGPGAALSMVLPYCRQGQVLVLMADNVFSQGDIGAIIGYPNEDLVIGTADLDDPEQAARLTRINENGQTFEGPIVNTETEQWLAGLYRVWLGPLMVNRDQAINAFERYPCWRDGELKIGPVLCRIPRHVGPESFVTVPCNTHDVGVLNGEWSEDPSS